VKAKDEDNFNVLRPIMYCLTTLSTQLHFYDDDDDNDDDSNNNNSIAP